MLYGGMVHLSIAKVMFKKSGSHVLVQHGLVI